MLRRVLFLFTALFCAFFAAPDCARATECVELPIVMYHHMSEKPRLWGRYVLSVQQFENDLVYLRDEGFTTVSTEELLAWCDGEGELPKKPVMITFDDGYESTFVQALPLLEKYGMKSVVSIIGSVARQYSDIPDHMLDYSHMSWEAAAEAEAGGLMEVQCHSYAMHGLNERKGCGQVSGEKYSSYCRALTADIEAFQTEARKYFGHECHALALPFGFYSDDTLKIAGELGFRLVFTCTEQVNRLTGDPLELMELGRYNRPNGCSSEAFFSKWQS